MFLLNNKFSLFVIAPVFMGSLIVTNHVPFGIKEIDRNVTINNQDELAEPEIGRSTELGDNEEWNVTNTETYPKLERKKRWLALGICMNFPMCCDIKGKDNCAFFCPVCPVRRDYCK